ncbi:MAG: lamin tail domain-containing protein [Chloroflexi bacterium]|nr:lamin tail domain-containing protein [Chloroflexota bacterium]
MRAQTVITPVLFMPNRKRLPRFFLLLTLSLAFGVGVFSPRVKSVTAKPNGTPATNIVISEFRFRGDGAGNDEFIELYNPINVPVDIGGWLIWGSNNAGSTSTRATIPFGTVLLPGQYYLIAHTSYSGPQTADLTYGTGITDDGGVALTLADGTTVIDQTGLSAGSAYQEGTPLSALTSDVDQGYARANNGCADTNNNSADFLLTNPSAPQNFSSPLIPCLYITHVTSSKPDGIYTSGEVIDIDVTFSNNVNVTGSPLLLLETGTTDRNAVYLTGSDGDATITFRYTASSADSSVDLDYVSTTALSLNGGSIIGAVGNALLDLPAPGASGSLGANKNIQIDAVGSPSIVSFKRQEPAAAITTSDSLTFRIIFSEAVLNVDAADFVVTGLSGATVAVSSINGNTFDVNISGGDINTFNGPVGLNISPLVSIVDVALPGNSLPPTPEPPTDETYTLDNTAPVVVSINQADTQADPTSAQPVQFSIVFSEDIDSALFSASDIAQSGTATGVTWFISPTSDPQIYTLSATASGSGTLIPSMSAAQLKDLAGNDNAAFFDGNCAAPEPNNCVQLNVTGNPAVTVNQASGQADPTSALPIRFTVQFSEPINTATFTTSDITQTGTAASVVWSIANSGDNMTFTLSATSSGYGTIVPTIAANKTLDLSGNNNTDSASTDNSVTFVSTSLRSVIINEVAWMGTTSSLTGDEWIELYNTTNASINITGWTLRAADGTPSVTLNGVIPAFGYFLLERDDDTTVSDIPADQIYTGELSNSGEALSLLDASNVVIDTANGNGGAWPKGSSSTYESMERVGTSVESDSSWITNTSAKRNGKNANNGNILGTPKSANSQVVAPSPTPTAPPTATPVPTKVVIPPRPIINEILARPGFDWNQDDKIDVFDEFIEIKNLTVIDISLSGWRLTTVDGDSFALPNVTLKPNQRVVYYGKETNLLLSDGGETIRLSDSGGKIYDAFTYTIARTEDASFCRLPDGNPGNSWFEDCIPTPLLANTREGKAPEAPNGNQSPVCSLPDTLPIDFLLPECNGYGANIWNPFYWDITNWLDKLWLQPAAEKWRTFIE